MLAAAQVMKARNHVQDEIEMEETGEDFDALTDEEIMERYRKHEAESKSQIKGVQEEGVGMSSIDLVRNFVLEHFETEAEQIRVYKERWLPIERACFERDTSGKTTVVAAACEHGFAAALEKLGAGLDTCEPVDLSVLDKISGHPDSLREFLRKVLVDSHRSMAIYTCFQAWWQSEAAVALGGYEARVAAFADAACAAGGGAA